MAEKKHTEGLRARKARATENAIERAAVELALEGGIDSVTVDDICERAFVSRSTFFNYFDGRDYAIIGKAIVIPGREECFAVLGRHSDDLVRGLFELLFAALGRENANPEIAGSRARLIREQPGARHLEAEKILAAALAMAPVAVAWLTIHSENAKLASAEREVSLTLAIVYALVTAAVDDIGIPDDGNVVIDEARYAETLRDLRALLPGS